MSNPNEMLVGMVELIGFATPVGVPVLSKLAEHTYVISSSDHRWDCNGDERGEGEGREICRGNGDLKSIIEIAGWDGMARIVYGKDGVCHQIANRILAPAGVKVIRAKYYNLSSMRYGHYGRDWKNWPKFRAYIEIQEPEPSFEPFSGGLHEEAATFEGFAGSQPVSWPDLEDLEEELVGNQYEPQRDYSTDGRVQAFRGAIDERLGEDFDRKKRQRLLDIQLESLGPQDAVVVELEQGQISKEEYFLKFTKLDQDCLAAMAEVLGEDDFVRLFDVKPDEAPPPADPKIFAQAHGLSKPPKLPD